MTRAKSRRSLALPVVGLACGTLLLAACSSSSSTPDSNNSPDNSSPSAGTYNVNVDDCTDPAAATAPVSGTWKIGYSLPLSGPVAGVVGYYLDGWKARIDLANSDNELNGLKIDVEYLDDAFTPDRAKTNATQFIQKDNVNSLIVFGSGGTGAMADDQNAACVPLLYPSSSVAQYRDISQYPWTIQFLPNADNEAKYDVQLIQSKFPDGTKVGVAENQTASGKGYSEAFSKAASGTNLDIVLTTPSTDPAAAATALKAANPDVVYIAGISNDCGPVTAAMGRVGFKPKMIIAPSNCADQTGWIAAGDAANGVIVPSWTKNPLDPANASDEDVKSYLAHVTGDDQGNTITVSGWQVADLTIQTLKHAQESANGLSKASVIDAARDLNIQVQMMINGIKWISTPTDMIGMSGFQTQVWDASKKAFVNEGDVISIGG